MTEENRWPTPEQAKKMHGGGVPDEYDDSKWDSGECDISLLEKNKTTFISGRDYLLAFKFIKENHLMDEFQLWITDSFLTKGERK